MTPLIGQNTRQITSITARKSQQTTQLVVLLLRSFPSVPVVKEFPFPTHSIFLPFSVIRSLTQLKSLYCAPAIAKDCSQYYRLRNKHNRPTSNNLAN